MKPNKSEILGPCTYCGSKEHWRGDCAVAAADNLKAECDRLRSVIQEAYIRGLRTAMVLCNKHAEECTVDNGKCKGLCHDFDAVEIDFLIEKAESNDPDTQGGGAMVTDDLERFIKENAKNMKPFAPCSYFNEIGDFIDAQLENVPHYKRRINDALTVMKALDDNRVIGIQIKCISHVLKGKEPYRTML